MKREFIVERQGRSYVLYAGLLDLAHQQGLRSIRTELVQAPTEANQHVAICKAIVTMEKDGHVREFTGYGDANPVNVTPAMVQCLIRMSETRGKSRALRDAVNIGVAAFEELGENVDGDDTGLPEDRVTPIRTNSRQQTRTATRPATPAAAPRPAPRSAPDPNVTPITESQINAIRNLARRTGINAEQYAAKHADGTSLDSLTIAQAGNIIRLLSAEPTAATANK